MNLKKSLLVFQEKNSRDLNNAKDYQTLADLMEEQNITIDEAKTVHQRRDLDSLG